MDSGFKVLDSEFLVSGIWILDSNRQWILGSLSCIPGSKVQGTGFHSKKNCRIPESTSRYFRIPKSCRIPLHGARELTVERQFVVLLDIAFRPL